MLPPTVRLRAGVVGINQNLLVNSLIDVVSDDSPVTLYEFQDNGSGAGYFELNGARQAAGSFFQVTPAQLPSLIYRGATSRVGETFTVRATNAFGVSAPRTAGITTGNSRPIVSALAGRVRSGEEIAITRLLNYFDADGDQARTYGFVDRSHGEGSGQFFYNGVAQAQANWFFVPAADLSRVAYRGGSLGGQVENLGVMVSDGVSFSDVTEFGIRTQGKPVVSAGRTTPVRPGERVAAQSLFQVTDPDGDAISLYYIVDRLSHPSSGYFEFQGVRQPDANFIRVPANELNQLFYVAGDGTIQTENVGVVAFDGSELSDVVNLPVSFPSTTPVEVVGTDTTLDVDEPIAIQSLLNVTGTGGEPITRYWLVDRSHGNDGGYFEVDGVRVDSARFFTVEGDQIGSVVYRGGSINETESIGVQVLVGSRLSDTVDFQITTETDDPIVEPPVVPELELIDISGRVGTVFELTELFRTSSQFDRFALRDTDASADSGFFSVGGVDQVNGASLLLDADQVNSVRFHLSANAGTEEFQMFILDGTSISAAETGSVTTIVSPEIEARNDSISLDTLEQTTLNRLFRKLDSGPEHTVYQVFDELETPVDGPISIADRSARLILDGENLERGVVRELSAADFNRLIIQGAEVDFGRSIDPILVRASTGDGVFTEWERINVNTDPVGTDALQVLQPDATSPDPEAPPVPVSMPSLSGVPGETGRPDQFVFTYSFLDGNGNVTPSYYEIGEAEQLSQPLNQGQRESFRQAIETVESYINAQFIETPYEVTGSAAQIVVGATLLTPDRIPADAYAPPTIAQQIPLPILDDEGNELVDEEGNLVDEDGNLLFPNDGRGTREGDIWFSTIEFDPNPFFPPDTPANYGLGSPFFTESLRTIIGALGLVEPTDVDPTLSSFNDFNYNTILSGETDGVFNPLNGVHPEAATPSTPMLYDVLQLQDVFGANPDSNKDDTSYIFDVAHQRSIYDVGGVDTFEFSANVTDENIDLRQGQFSSVLGVNQSLLITYGTVIENVRTGSGNDSIRGNEEVNVLNGGSGNDILRGGGDNDQLFGERGNDTYQWFLGDGRDTIFEQRLGGTDVLEIHDASNRLDALEDDLYFRRLGDDLRIDLRLDQGEGIGTVVVKDFAQSGSEVETLRLFDSAGIQIGDDIDLNSVFTTVDSFGGRYQATVRQGENGAIAVPVV
jgi:hypothetical protein